MLGAAPIGGGRPTSPAQRDWGVHQGVRLEGISKRFGSFWAVRDVSFQVEPGSVHALIGENGAGKTTLMRLLYGLYSPDDGVIEVDGESLRLKRPADGLAAGICMVHQQSLLLAELTVAENVLLGFRSRGPVGRGQVEKALTDLAKESRIPINPLARVGTLSVAARQRAELLIALYHEAAVIILDEPTTILTPGEVEQLFEILHRLKAAGRTILFVTHKLNEVMAITDAVTVMRRGLVTLSRRTSDTSVEELTAAILGLPDRQESGRMAPDDDAALAILGTGVSSGGQLSREMALNDERLRISDVVVAGAGGVPVVDAVSLAVWPGEIVALTGIEGNGQREVAEAIVGLRRVQSGSLRLDDRDITAESVRGRRTLGIGYVPEDRLGVGVCAHLSVADNIAAASQRSSTLSRHGFRNRKASADMTKAIIEKYSVACRSISDPISSLSGGNAQKVVVGRELERDPKLLVLVQPTQGLDIGSTARIWDEMRRFRDRGQSVLLVSTDFAEVCGLADRAVVMWGGRMTAELSGADLNEEAIGRAALGEA